MEELSEFLSRTNVVDSPTTLDADIAQTTSLQTTAKPSTNKDEKDVSSFSILRSLKYNNLTLQGFRFKF